VGCDQYSPHLIVANLLELTVKLSNGMEIVREQYIHHVSQRLQIVQ
jgi:hypothetical protein